MPVRRLSCSLVQGMDRFPYRHQAAGPARPQGRRPALRGWCETVTPLSAGLGAARRARELVAAQVTALPAPQRGDAVLLASELVTNAVLHGASPITLRLSAAPGRIRVEVHDHGTALPVPRTDRPRIAPGGLGLVLVEALASYWGVTRTPDRAGKGVWFEMHVRAPRS